MTTFIIMHRFTTRIYLMIPFFNRHLGRISRWAIENVKWDEADGRSESSAHCFPRFASDISRFSCVAHWNARVIRRICAAGIYLPVIWRLRRNHVFSIFCSKLLDRMISIVYVSGKALREPSVSVEYQTESIWWNPRIRIGGERGALVACLPVFHVLNQLTHLRASSSSNLTLLCTCMCRWKLVFHSILIGSTFSLEFLHYDSRPMDWFIIITLKREESDVWWRTTNSQKSSNGSVFWYCAP